MGNYKVIDNFLYEDEWKLIHSMCCRGDGLPYYVSNAVASDDDPNPFHYYFTHTFYNYHNTQSPHIEIVQPLIDKINPLSLIRIKTNLYPRTEIVDIHEPHKDFDFDHKAALYMVNDNDGFTTMYDGYKVESKANRMVFFDPQTPHSSSTCSNQKYRVTINFNYF